MRNIFLSCFFLFADLHGANCLYFPDQELGELFSAVQLSEVFRDSKVFVDSNPRLPPQKISELYLFQKQFPGFNLKRFVKRFFILPTSESPELCIDRNVNLKEALISRWDCFKKCFWGDTCTETTLIPLPFPYMIAGGRFQEMYYWDNFFIMLGLAVANRWELIEDILNNFAYLLDTFGYIPNSNRSYYLGRSQPPLFSMMVQLYAHHFGMDKALKFLPFLEQEYCFWMDGSDKVSKQNQTYRRVVWIEPGLTRISHRLCEHIAPLLPQIGSQQGGDNVQVIRPHPAVGQNEVTECENCHRACEKSGLILNRYWSDCTGPRPESYLEDYLLAQKIPEEHREHLYRNIRAAAESGWDFSGRWSKDPVDLLTMRVTDMLPVDLNSLLYNLEWMLSQLYKVKEDCDAAQYYADKASRRACAIQSLFWNSEKGFFQDYLIQEGKRADCLSLAAVFPLVFGLASQKQADQVAALLEERFLKKGGLVTTLNITSEQWDFPNGWPPLQWAAVAGLMRFNHHDLAQEVVRRWLAINEQAYAVNGELMEKYNVVEPHFIAEGGEYPVQIGFGWSNGVALAFFYTHSASRIGFGQRESSRD